MLMKRIKSLLILKSLWKEIRKMEDARYILERKKLLRAYSSFITVKKKVLKEISIIKKRMDTLDKIILMED
jgi:hypothetical protein